MRDQSQTENDARLGVVAAGGQEASRDFGQSLAGRQQYLQEGAADFGQSQAARQQAIQEILALRSVPLNEASALLTGSQVQSPQFVNTPQTTVGPTDFIQAQQLATQANQANFRAKTDTYNSNLQGLYGLAGTGVQAGGYAAGVGKRAPQPMRR
jgi:hypothetical protein